jgi:hypothetical protein
MGDFLDFVIFNEMANENEAKLTREPSHLSMTDFDEI